MGGGGVAFVPGQGRGTPVAAPLSNAVQGGGAFSANRTVRPAAVLADAGHSTSAN